MNEIIENLDEIKLIFLDLQGVVFHEKKDPDDKELENIILSLSELKEMAGKRNIEVFILSGRSHDKTLSKIQNDSKIKVICSSIDKVSSVIKVLKEKSLNFENVMSIGNDLLDIPLMKFSRISAAPNSAKRMVKRISNIVLKSDHGNQLLTELTGIFNNHNGKINLN